MIYDIYDIDSLDNEEYEKEMAIKDVSVEMLKKKLTVQTKLLTDTITYGFRKNQENIKLLQRVRELERSQNMGEIDITA